MARGKARAGFDLDLSYGIEAENQLLKILKSEGNKIEVKRDEQAWKTGNVFIELRRKTYINDGSYIMNPSGINKTEADWWAIVFRPKRFILIKTEHLLNYVDEAIEDGRGTWGGDNNMTYGALVPLKWMIVR